MSHKQAMQASPALFKHTWQLPGLMAVLPIPAFSSSKDALQSTWAPGKASTTHVHRQGPAKQLAGTHFQQLLGPAEPRCAEVLRGLCATCLFPYPFPTARLDTEDHKAAGSVAEGLSTTTLCLGGSFPLSLLWQSLASVQLLEGVQPWLCCAG